MKNEMVHHPMIITYILLFTIFVVATSYELPDLPRIILLRGGNIDDIRDEPKVRPIMAPIMAPIICRNNAYFVCVSCETVSFHYH